MSAELILPYAKQVLTDHLEHSVRGFLEHLRNSSDKLIYNILFNLSLAFRVFRACVRRINSEVILASRSKFLLLFFGLNMPFYMEAYTRYLMIRIYAVSLFGLWVITNHESYSLSGNESKGEGGENLF